MDINSQNQAKETISSYLRNYIGEKEPVIVKKLVHKITKDVTLYVAVGLTKSQLSEVQVSKELPEEILDNLIIRQLLEDKKQNIFVIFLGELSKYRGFEELVQHFPLRRREEPVFRNYVISREKQLQLYGTVNVCNSSRKSWESVIMKVGHDNGVVIKIINKLNDSTL